jgi:probable HAF family extracellular repeat protein
MVRKALLAAVLAVPLLAAGAVTAAASPAPAAVTAVPSFAGLGPMPIDYGGGTYANGLSGDGSTVVGYAWIDGANTRPFRWTAAGGYQDLGNLGADSSNGRAYDASFDGSVVVGQTSSTSGITGFRWSGGAGMQALPMWQALATSNDGAVAAGMNLRWTAPGTVEPLGFLGGNNYTSAYGVSGDGQTVVGFSETSPNRYAHAFRWTPAAGIQDLGVTNGTESDAWGVSANGALVYGEARDSAGFWRAYRWTASLGMRDLGTLGGPMSTAHAASADGSVIVGKSLATSSSGSLRAFRWTASGGMRDLRQELLNAGVTAVQNWTLAVAAGISDDGSVITGWGYPAPLTPAQPFLAVLPVAGGGGGGVALSSLSLSSSSVRGGNSVTATVRLSAAAPSGGVAVALSSSDTSVATVPASVTVPAGATSATFTVSTRSVSSDRTVTISASYGGVTRTATLTVKRR